MSQVKRILSQYAETELQSLNSIVAMGSQVSIESKEVTFIDSVKSNFYDFVARVKGFITNIKMEKFDARPIESAEMLKAFNARSFGVNRGLYVDVIPGFVGDWVAFLNLLIKDILPAAEASEQSLKVAITKLATILNEPDRLKAQSGIRDLESNLTLVSNEKYEAIKAHFKNNSKSQAVVSDVTSRNGDMSTAYAQMHELNGRLSKLDFAKIDSLVERLGALSSTLSNTLAPEGEKAEVAGLVASQLSELFYKLGITLTAASMLLEVARQQTDAMTKNVPDLIKQMGPVEGTSDGDHEYR